MLKRHHESKIAKLKAQVKCSNTEVRFLKQRVKELSQSRDLQKQKYKTLQSQKGQFLDKKTLKVIAIKRHKYDELTVKICVSLAIISGVSLRGVVAILLCIQAELGIFEEIPSKGSIDNWLKKVGFHRYGAYESYQYEEDYCLIIDDSMMVGSQRLLIILSVKASKLNQVAISFSDVHIECIAVKKSWTGEGIEAEIQKVKEKKGKNPLYCISDSATIMLKAQNLALLTHINDCSHGFSSILEKSFKADEDFIAWQKALGQAKFKGVMKDYAYGRRSALLPPKQRTVARFMNIDESVIWSKEILENFKNLSMEEQIAFQWVKNHQDFVTNRLTLAFELTQKILVILKNKGLSYKSIGECLKICKEKAYKNIKDVLQRVSIFLQNEKSKLPNKKAIWHTCSDIIESMFGKFKYNLPTNPILGVTHSVLQLNIMTQPIGKTEIKSALENVFLSDLMRWKQEQLFDNQVVRKQKVFKK